MLWDTHWPWVMLSWLWVEASLPSCLGGLVYGNMFVAFCPSTSQVTSMSPGVKSEMRQRSWTVAWVSPLGSQDECKSFTMGWV